MYAMVRDVIGIVIVPENTDMRFSPLFARIQGISPASHVGGPKSKYLVAI
jgi:hypothetical protein